MRAHLVPTLPLLMLALLLALPSLAQPSYLLFESGPVRPVALSPDGSKLFVTNIPDGRLEIFDVNPANGLLTSVASVPVGLEPVAVAARNDSEVWVVNHLSDSVSIVDVASSPPRVVRTLLVGDEPRDIVFAGSPLRAFISTAHRGQHRNDSSIAGVPGKGDPTLTQRGTSRADVWVFDAASPGSALGGLPVSIKSFYADTPRALATDGTNVYVAAFHSGNQTTALNQLVTDAISGGSFSSSCNGNGSANGMPGPGTNADGDPAPATGIIVKRSGSTWVDSQGCEWNSVVNFLLPDRDVFAMNANTLSPGTVFTGVGTIVFNMTINPVTGKLYVTNTDSQNHVDFEGPGDFGGSTVQGHLSESRVTVIDPAGPTVTPRHLNSHIDYGQRHTDAGANHTAIDDQVPHSLATPLQVVVSDDLADQKVYVAAFGSSKIGVFDASALEAGTFDPTVTSASYIPTSGGPAGLALSDDHHRLYVLTRFDNSVSVIDVESGGTSTLQTVRLPSPEPASVVEGRPFLYDAVATSGNGEASCASCHIFGDLDSIGWNLGNPDDIVTDNPQAQIFGGGAPDFHPMKGPMTTQTLRGLSTHGALHWRGDRSNGAFGEDACTGSTGSNALCDETFSFDNFIVAFEGLVGKHGTISTPEMEQFTDFALQLMLPPNPVPRLDGTKTAAQASGESLYFTHPSDAGQTCNFCHVLDPAQGFFGTGGDQSEEGETQRFKVSHLRNMYSKVGMFGIVTVNPFAGNQVRGFGFLHDGSVDTIFTFLDQGPFNLTTQQVTDLEQFLLAFPSDLAPVVGQQVSIGPGSPSSFGNADVNDRVSLLDARAGASFDSYVLGGTTTECDVVVSTVEAGAPRSYLRQGDGTYLPDDGGPALLEAVLRAKANPAGDAQTLHYACVPPGSGVRMGLDRDEDSVHNGLDNCPAWPNGAGGGTCTAGDVALLGSRCDADAACGGSGVCSQSQEDGDGDGAGDACEPLLLPEPGLPFAWLLGAAFLASRAGRRRR